MSRILRPARAINAALRSYATVAADSTTVGGVKVAAVDAGQPTSSVTVVVKAGSRYETAPGVAHVLKNFAFKVREPLGGVLGWTADARNGFFADSPPRPVQRSRPFVKPSCTAVSSHQQSRASTSS